MSEPSRDVDAQPTGGQGVKLSQSPPAAAAAPPRAGDEPASLGQQLKGQSPSTPQASSHYAHGYRGPYGFPAAWHQGSEAQIPAAQPFAAAPTQQPYRYAAAPGPSPASFAATPAQTYGAASHQSIGVPSSTWPTNPLGSARHPSSAQPNNAPYPNTVQPNISPMQQPPQYGFYDPSTPSPFRSLGQYYPSLSPGYGMQPPAPYYGYPPLQHTSPSPQASPYQHGYQFQAPLSFGGGNPFYQVPAAGPPVTYQPQSGAAASAPVQQQQPQQHPHLVQHNAAQAQGAGGAPAGTAQGDSGSASIKKERNPSPPQVPAPLHQDSTALPFQPATLILRPAGGHQSAVAPSSSGGQTATPSSVVVAPRVQPAEAPNREATTVGGSVEEEDSRDSPAALPHRPPAASAGDLAATESQLAAPESQDAASQDVTPPQDHYDGPVAFDDDESVLPPYAEQAGHGPEPAQAETEEDDAMNLDTRTEPQPRQAAGSDDEMPDVLPDDDSQSSLSPCPTPVEEEEEATEVADQHQPTDEDQEEQLPLGRLATRRELAKCKTEGCGRLLGFHNKYGLCPAHKCVGCNGPKDKDDWRCALCMAKREENAQKKHKRASTAAEKRAPVQQQSEDTQQQSNVAGESQKNSQPAAATTSDPDRRPYNLRRNRRQTQFFGSPPRPEVAEPDYSESEGPGSAAGRDDDVGFDPESEWVTDEEELGNDDEMQVDEQEDEDIHNEEENDEEHDDEETHDLDEMDVDDAEEADDEADTPASFGTCAVDGCDGPVESNTRGNTLCKNHKCNGPYCNGLRRQGFVHCETCGASIRAANRKWREKRKREAAGARPRTCAKDGCDEPLHNRNTSNLCRAHKCRRCPNIARPGLYECGECYEEAKAKWRAAAAARRRRETLERGGGGGGGGPSASARGCPVAGCGFELSSHARSVFCHNHKCTMCLHRAAPGHRKCKPCLALSSERARKLVETQRAEGKCTIYKCNEPATMGIQGGMGKCEAHLKRDYGYHKKYNDKKREEK